MALIYSDSGFPPDRIDSYAYVAMRDYVNTQLASIPPDEANLYVQSFLLEQKYRRLGRRALVVDVGCSEGWQAVRAAQKTGVKARLEGVDIDAEPNELHGPPPELFRFHHADVMDMPYEDNSVDLILAQNSIFRFEDPMGALAKMRNAVKKKSHIALGTNDVLHGFWRHRFTRMVAADVIREYGLPDEPPADPAHGLSFRDIPALVKVVGGLKAVDWYWRDYDIVVTPRALPAYLYTIETAVTLLSDSRPEIRDRWREIVAERITPLIVAMTEPDEAGVLAFRDSGRRGFYLLEKE